MLCRTELLIGWRPCGDGDRASGSRRDHREPHCTVGRSRWCGCNDDRHFRGRVGVGEEDLQVLGMPLILIDSDPDERINLDALIDFARRDPDGMSRTVVVLTAEPRTLER